MLSLTSEFRCWSCFVYKFLSLRTSIISTFLNLSKLTQLVSVPKRNRCNQYRTHTSKTTQV
jgi:hypothetical protein